jgi:hypothetical protein
MFLTHQRGLGLRLGVISQIAKALVFGFDFIFETRLIVL